eukprot:7381628-Prymnesium_polylepis.2
MPMKARTPDLEMAARCFESCCVSTASRSMPVSRFTRSSNASYHERISSSPRRVPLATAVTCAQRMSSPVASGRN